ncbi:MAG: hypothetical protein HY819_11000 [Acidobacteria bacterium]|nr:hypothetical protein [Acidobacteriota bacterium]
MDFWISIVLAIVVIVLLVVCYIYFSKLRKRYEQECFDAMLRMLLQPTANNISALESILKTNWIRGKTKQDLLYQAELEADCLSIMPTGEVRSSQPFLQQRYNQIFTAAQTSQAAVAELVKARLTSFKKS